MIMNWNIQGMAQSLVVQMVRDGIRAGDDDSLEIDELLEDVRNTVKERSPEDADGATKLVEEYVHKLHDELYSAAEDIVKAEMERLPKFKTLKIGTIKTPSGKLLVSDPCYVNNELESMKEQMDKNLVESHEDPTCIGTALENQYGIDASLGVAIMGSHSELDVEVRVLDEDDDRNMSIKIGPGEFEDCQEQIGIAGVDAGMMMIADMELVADKWAKQEYQSVRGIEVDGKRYVLFKDFQRYDSTEMSDGTKMCDLPGLELGDTGLAGDEELTVNDLIALGAKKFSDKQKTEEGTISFPDCCNRIDQSSDQVGILTDNSGVALSSGYGDGCYPVLTNPDGDTIVVAFIGE